MNHADSLDWIWDDFGSLDSVEELEDDDDDDYDNDDDHRDDSDDVSSADLSVGCSALWVDDPEMARQPPNGTKRRRRGDGDDDDDGGGGGGAESETIVGEGDVTEADEDMGDLEPVIDGFYADAIDVARDLLTEVRLVWTDTLDRCAVDERYVPDSYTKTSSIEKLVLLYASNFVEQFKAKYPNRKQLILVHENECGVQKCVCTTIKPTRLVYHDLNDLTSYTEFVAKHITYTRLKDPCLVPKRIVSPAMVLETQTANCFELATLLASFLIGCGYNAFVVHGYATKSVCNNDRTKVKLDLPKRQLKDVDDGDGEPENSEHVDDNYDVEPMLDLCSEYVTLLIDEEKNKAVAQTDVDENDADDSPDRLRGKRIHCWVLVAPSDANDESATVAGPYFFVEPSTGELTDVSDGNYTGIEAIWNDKNYWVNLQTSDARYNFGLTNTEYWEHFLPDEPPQGSRGVTSDTRHGDNVTFRHLVMPGSWVKVLDVPRNRYFALYPAGEKVVLYMNAREERYGEYVMPDGLIEKTTFYAEPDYTSKMFVREVYKHRADKLVSVEMNYVGDEMETVEYFMIGRKDCLKTNKFCGDGNRIETKRSATFYNLRPDSMVELRIDAISFVVVYKDRSDLLFWRICEFGDKNTNESHVANIKRRPTTVIDKYLRDESKHKDRDIATSQFNLSSNTIYVQYQYGEGQITQSSRLFEKPSVTSSEQFIPNSVTENIVYPYEGQLKPHEAYSLLQDMMRAESEALHEVSILENDIIGILETRGREKTEFKLIIDALDWDRNYKIRKVLQIEKDKKLAIAKRDKAKQIDYALKYFATAENSGPPLWVRDQIVKSFRKSTKREFTRTNVSFNKKQSRLQFLLKELEADNFKEPEHKNKTIMLCSSLKYELNVLLLKMQRYREIRATRYNNLASYLNSNPNFKTLPPLKVV